MKVVKKQGQRQPSPRVCGTVITDGNHTFMEVAMTGPGANMCVNLETGRVVSVGMLRDESDVPHPHAALLLEGVPPVAVPAVKSEHQQAQEFLVWAYANTTRSGFSGAVQYTPNEVLEGRTNANVRRQWQTWLAARGV